jgi:hypothetical protein
LLFERRKDDGVCCRAGYSAVVEQVPEGVPIKRGPKGGRKHEPGRGHRRKSEKRQKERIAKRLHKKHQKKKDKARQQKEAWENLPDELKNLLGPEDMKVPEEDQ